MLKLLKTLFTCERDSRLPNIEKCEFRNEEPAHDSFRIREVVFGSGAKYYSLENYNYYNRENPLNYIYGWRSSWFVLKTYDTESEAIEALHKYVKKVQDEAIVSNKVVYP